MMEEIDKEKRKNMRIYEEEEKEVMEWLNDDQIEGIDIFYKDKWKKRRKWKRSLVRDENIESLESVMKKGEKLRLEQDIENYVKWKIKN